MTTLSEREELRQGLKERLADKHENLMRYNTIISSYQKSANEALAEITRLENDLKNLDTIAVEAILLTGRNISDACFSVLSGVKDELHVERILELMHAANYKVKGKRELRSLSYQLSTDSRFETQRKGSRIWRIRQPNDPPASPLQMAFVGAPFAPFAPRDWHNPYVSPDVEMRIKSKDTAEILGKIVETMRGKRGEWYYRDITYAIESTGFKIAYKCPEGKVSDLLRNNVALFKKTDGKKGFWILREEIQSNSTRALQQFNSR